MEITIRKNLSNAQVKSLIEKGETSLLSFINKKKVKYKGRLKLNNEWQIVMEFASKSNV